MEESIESTFTQGLLSGYAGGSDITETERAGIQGKRSHIEENGTVYDDQWFANTNGGGQELIDVGETRYTRLYAGGVPKVEILQGLGISAEDVGKYLKSKIVELGLQTRLFSDCSPAADGDWQYLYSVIRKDDSIEIVAAEELITYMGIPVHIHMFMLSPVR